MPSFAEQMRHDPALRAFVEAQKGQTAVDLAALKVEHRHLQDAHAAVRRENEQLRQALDAKQRRKGKG